MSHIHGYCSRVDTDIFSRVITSNWLSVVAYVVFGNCRFQDGYLRAIKKC